MTCHSDAEIRRCADGTIDYAFYASRARGLRAEAIAQSPSVLVRPARRMLSAIHQIATPIRSAMIILASRGRDATQGHADGER